MSNVDLLSFYRQARQWQLDKEQQDREREIQLQKDLENAWKGATAEIRSIFPIEGITIYEGEPRMTADFPHAGGNYQFDVALPGAKYTPSYDEERFMKGVIRVVMNCYVTYSFKPVVFSVWIAGSPQSFSNPFEAFLACVVEMGLNLEFTP